MNLLGNFNPCVFYNKIKYFASRVFISYSYFMVVNVFCAAKYSHYCFKAVDESKRV